MMVSRLEFLSCLLLILLNPLSKFVELIFIGRCLERVGDHITNIAEDILYIESGEAYIAKFES